MSVFISVIVPVYNVVDYLPKCIKSICEQTYRDIEIILIDDGSTDGSSEVCDKYAKEDSRIIVIHKGNGGLTTARKAGIKVAQGKYVGFVDGDDWIESEMYGKMLRVALEKDVPLVLSGMYREYEGIVYAEWKAGGFDEGLYKDDKLYYLKQHLFEMNGSSCNKLFEKNLLYKRLMEIDDRLSGVEDDLFSLECILDVEKLYIMDASFYHGVERITSATHSVHKNWYFQMHWAIQHYNAMMDIFPDKYFAKLCQRTLAKKLIHGIKHVCRDMFFPEYWIDFATNMAGDKRIVLYGGGEVGESYYYWITRMERYHITGWVDKFLSESKWTKHNLAKPEEILMMKYDFVLIAIGDENVVKSIRNELACIGIERNKIVWEKPKMLMSE